MSKLLIGLVFIVCVSVNYAVPLVPICRNSTFTYAGVEVNSVYKLPYNRTFMQALEYIIDTKINFDDYFDNKMSAKNLNIYRKTWNNQFLKVFSEIFINKPENLRTISSKVVANTLELSKKYLELCKKEKKQSFSDLVILKLKNSLNFHMTLEYLHKNKFDQNNKTIDEVEKLLQTLEVEDNQTLAFETESIDDVYENTEILSLDKFILNRVNDTLFDLRRTGTLMMNIMIPFNDSKHKASHNCISSEELPKFYQNRR